MDSICSIQMNLKPYGDRVIVKPLIEDTKTEDGIEFASAVAQENVRGEVVSSKEWLNDTLPVGTKVIFSKYAGEEVTVGDDVYKIINLSEVLAYES